MWNGKVWGMPGYTNVRGLFWNIDILNEVGLDSSQGPQTLEELEDLAAKATRVESDGRITRLGFAPWLGGYYPAGWFWSFGGDIYDPQTGMPTLTREENVDAWHWVQEWAQRYPPERYALASQGGLSGALALFRIGLAASATTAADNSVNNLRIAAPRSQLRHGESPSCAGRTQRNVGRWDRSRDPQGGKASRGGQSVPALDR